MTSKDQVPEVYFEAEVPNSEPSSQTNNEDILKNPKLPEEEEEDTIDEPVWKTIWRDFRSFGIKLFHVLFPHGRGPRALRDWDLWGPLLLCFGLETLLTVGYSKKSISGISGIDEESAHALVFTIVWIIIWAGSVLVTVNTQLIGGNLSFFQCVCLLGYCLFPLVVAAFVAHFVPFWVKLIVVAACIAWSSAASLSFFAASVPPTRKALALYPTMLFYIVIGSIIIVSITTTKFN